MSSAEYVVDNFYDARKSPYSFLQMPNKRTLLLEKKRLYDNATPSGNSTMARNLQRLGILIWKRRLSE